MKNFKKVIAFLMVAAMTLGMGLTAFASEAEGPTKVDCFTVAKIEPAAAGETVTISILVNEETNFAATKVCLNFNPALVETAKAEIKALNSSYNKCWKLDGGTGNYIETGSEDGDYLLKVAVASAAYDDSTAAAGTAVLEVKVKLKADVAAGDRLATLSLPDGFKSMVVTGTNSDGDYTFSPDDVMTYPNDVDVLVSAATSSSDTSSSSDGPNPPTSGATKPNNTTAATNNGGGNASVNNGGNTGANNGTSAAANNASNAATTAAPSKAKNVKSGDTAPVAALIVVAIAAFGTAVVVYRKKVNA